MDAMKYAASKSGTYIPERSYGMDGQWPISSPAKPKQTA